jgi:hypothetical protein
MRLGGDYDEDVSLLPASGIESLIKEAAVIELTEEQRQELDNEEPRARDPLTNRTYVLVDAKVYARLKGLLDDLPETGMLMNEVMADDDANDPYLESYQDYTREAP